MLGLITCFFNPTNSSKLKNNYIKFREQLNHPILTVELAFNDQPFFIEDSIRIRGFEENIMWQKERLLNLALQSLPHKFDKVAWLDADIIFENPNWFEETEEHLETYPVVQLFESAYETGGNSTNPNTGIGFGKFNLLGKNLNYSIEPFPLTGLAWGARRDILSDGFFDLSIVGSGDLYQINAWTGDWNSKYTQLMTPKLRKEFLRWAWNPSQKVLGKIGYISGKIEHLKHGTLANRNYYNRHRILIENQFCPLSDLVLDKNELFKWNTNKSALKKEIKSYFFKRNTDEE